ncbi:MAG: aldehyde-activating protein [Rhodoferax sp.]|nr:aldehyde-activating protein [Rhodoferax sp.]
MEATTSPAMKVQGACHCGQIRFEAEVDPAQVRLCNCTDCQVLTGSAFRLSVPAPKESFRLASGLPSIYIKTGDSGTPRAHAFCPNCGTPLYATAVTEDPPSYTLRVGTLAQRAQLPPKHRIWCRSALAWAQDVSGVPGQDTQ